MSARASKHGTAIEWTHGEGFKGETWNPVTGCSKVSPGCAHCYAETLTARFAGRPGYIEEHRPWTPENAEHNVWLHPERLEQPLRWKKPRMVFTNSMSDLFHEEIPDYFIDRVFAAMALTPRHVFQVLTKRPERAREWFAGDRYSSREERVGEACGDAFGWMESWPDERPFPTWPLPNVWLGVSIENARHTWRADVLREIPAAVRFISAEPLLGSLYPKGEDHAPGIRKRRNDHNARAGREERAPGDSAAGTTVAVGTPPVEAGAGDPGAESRAPLDLTGIDWLIVGGESGGRDARPMHPEWARELRQACHPLVPTGPGTADRDPAAPAFFFKQWGSWSPPAVGDVLATTHMVYRGAGPKSGGRLLDGREWNEMPAVQS